MDTVFYTIGDLVVMTGLTDRTIRSYIASGILQGDKQDGRWRFTVEQVESFLLHPAVRPSILAKQNAEVYDFLLDRKKTSRKACIILDLPDSDPEKVSQYFCRRITEGEGRDLRFFFDRNHGIPRVILRGDPNDLLRLMGQTT